MKAPCYNCPNRKLGCHAICDQYKAYQKQQEHIRERRAEYNRQKEIWPLALGLVK